MTTASAPGKIILFGEHAVVYGRPALAVPVTQVHVDVEIRESSRAGIWLSASGIYLHAELSKLPRTNALRTVIENVFGSLGMAAAPSLKLTINSSIPVASGLGSGAAVAVAVTRALSTHLGFSLSDEQINALAYEAEKLHHGTPSGIDNTVITYAKPVYFIKNQPIETFNVGAPFTIVIGDTGISAPTRESVGDLRKLWEADKAQWEAIFDQVGGIVKAAKQAIESGKWLELGPLMDANHALLQQMTVSSPELDRLVLAAKTSGAIGAKLSGGGRGGNMIALVHASDAEKVAAALSAAGAKNSIITKIENT
jgi:mevalonate kinase